MTQTHRGAGEAASPEGRLHEIRKYPNRRFYDTTSRSHLSLEEVRDLVVAGNEIRVTESQSGEDITAAVLTQIILKLDAPKLQVFPVPLLHELVRANDAFVTEFAENYFERTLRYFLDAQRRLGDQFQRGLGMPGMPEWPLGWPGFGGASNPYGWPSGASASPPEAGPGEPAPAAGGGAGEGPPEPGGGAPGAGEAGLERRLEKLQEELRELQRALLRERGMEEGEGTGDEPPPGAEESGGEGESA